MTLTRCQPRRSAGPAAALMAVLAAAAPAAPAEFDRGASFLDEFDTLDTKFWGVSDGWSNGPWMNCQWSRQATEVRDGKLLLSFLRQRTEKRDYVCGEIQSRAVYGYGTYEARLRTESGSGLNAAFFTYIGPHHRQPHDEIDVEVLTRDVSRVSLNTYVDGAPQNGQSVKLPQDADDGFITYAFVWSESGIEWYVDGVKMHETAPGTPLPEHDQKIYASFWGSDSFPNWMGPFEAPEAPLTMEVDWIAFTAQGDGCRFPASLVCQRD